MENRIHRWACSLYDWRFCQGSLSIVGLERFTVELLIRETSSRNIVYELLRVSLKFGAVGTGEELQFYYPWGETRDDAVKLVCGRNAFEVMWDDSIGYGLQMALFDAVGNALGVPVHALLGEKVRDRAKHFWWAIDMPPEDWASESRVALELGYRDFKAKGRPWYEISLRTV